MYLTGKFLNPPTLLIIFTRLWYFFRGIRKPALTEGLCSRVIENCMMHEYLGDGKQWKKIIFCNSFVQQDIPKESYKKRCELFEDFQRSFWLDSWLSNRKILTE